MKQSTSQFIENVRNIYIYLNKNYTPFLRMDQLETESVDLASIFNTQRACEYCTDSKTVNNLLVEADRDQSIVFSERFDFRTSDSQKLFGADIMARNIARTAALLKPEKRSITVLSLGVGDGRAAQRFTHVLNLPWPDRLIGVDIHGHFLTQAVINIPGLSVHEFDLNALAKGARLPLDDHSVDIAECAMVAHHIECFDSLVAEVRRILKTGGSFFYLDLIDKTTPEKIMHFEHDHQYPAFHGVEFFRDHLTIRKTIQRFFGLKDYIRVGPGILYLEAGR